MNVTKDVILDLYPLYLEQECSADTRALVEEYLRANPRHAEELRQAIDAPLPKTSAPVAGLAETQVLRATRRRVRGRAWVLGFAIFFSLAPFSVSHTEGQTRWLFLESPGAALIYGTVAVALWMFHAFLRQRSKCL